MSPRKYEMRQRAAAVEQTRQRILQATSACHRRTGITATGMEDVAREAGVALGTVYRHYPTLDHLIGACGAVFMQRFALPEPQEVRVLFAGLRSREERLSRLTEEIAGRYRDGAAGFVRVREAREDFEATGAAWAQIEASLDALAAEAVRPLRYAPARRAIVRGLIDARVWQSLSDQGLEAGTVQRALRDLLLAV